MNLKQYISDPLVWALISFLVVVIAAIPYLLIVIEIIVRFLFKMLDDGIVKIRNTWRDMVSKKAYKQIPYSNELSYRARLLWRPFYSLILFFMGVFFLCLSYQLASGCHDRSPSATFYAFINALKAFALDLDYTSMDKSDIISGLLQVVPNTWLCKTMIAFILVAAPFVSGATILTVIANMLPEFKSELLYFFTVKKHVYLFSSLNEQSLTLATSLAKERKYKFSIYVFANCRSEEDSSDANSLISRAADQGFICMKKDLSSIKVKRWKSAHYYFADSDDMNNLDTAIYMSNEGNRCWKNCLDVEMIVFCQNDSVTDYFENRTVDDKLHIRVIPYKTFAVYSQLFKQPLFLYLPDKTDDKKDFYVSIIGDNDWALEVFKAVLWCGQIKNVTLHIRWIVEDIATKKQLKYVIPDIELFKNSVDGLPYCDWEVVCRKLDTNGLREYLQREELLKSSVWFICHDVESTSIETAKYVRQIQEITREKQKIKGDVVDEVGKAAIFYQVSSDNVAKALNDISMPNNQKPENRYEMYAYASLAEQYSIESMQGDLFDLVNLVDGSWRNADSNKINEYRFRSTYAVVIHSLYKLYALGYVVPSELPRLNPVSESTLIERITFFRKKLLDEFKCDSFAARYEMGYMEHLRWVAYMRSTGYTSALFEEIEAVNAALGHEGVDTKNLEAKIHSALLRYPKEPKQTKFLSECKNYKSASKAELMQELGVPDLDELDGLSKKITDKDQDRDMKFETACMLENMRDRLKDANQKKVATDKRKKRDEDGVKPEAMQEEQEERQEDQEARDER